MATLFDSNPYAAQQQGGFYDGSGGSAGAMGAGGAPNLQFYTSQQAPGVSGPIPGYTYGSTPELEGTLGGSVDGTGGQIQGAA